MTVNNLCIPSPALIPSPCCNARLTTKSRHGPQRQWSPEEDEATVSTTASSSSPVQLFLESLLTTVDIPSAAVNVIEPYDGLKRQHSAESDCDSVTSSTSSSSNSRRPPSKKRQKHGIRVRFADVLITSVFTRPRTSKEEKSLLHYSFDEMDQFREEYYMERGRQQQTLVLQEMALVSSSNSLGVSNSNSTHVIVEEDVDYQQDEQQALSTRKHPVSKVVIHKDDLQRQDSKTLEEEVLEGSSSSPGFRAVYIANDCDDYSFDNPAFWNGNLTWY